MSALAESAASILQVRRSSPSADRAECPRPRGSCRHAAGGGGPGATDLLQSFPTTSLSSSPIGEASATPLEGRFSLAAKIALARSLTRCRKAIPDSVRWKREALESDRITIRPATNCL
ncbi:unnamed protein product [Lampetra fluviatilis]